MLAHLLPYFTFAAIHLFSGVSAAAIGTLPDYDNHNLGSGGGVNKRDEGGGQEGQDEVPAYLDEDMTLEEVTQLMAEIPDEVVEQGVDATEIWLREHRPHVVERDLDEDEDEEEDDEDEDEEMSLEETTQLMSEVPDEVAEQGMDATEEWLRAHRHDLAERDMDVVDLEARGGADAARCAAYIAWAIGLNANPLIKGFAIASKALKLKQLIDKMGGIKKAIKTLTDTKGKHAKPKGGKGKHRKGRPKSQTTEKESYAIELSKIAWQILSIDGIIKNCPKVFD